MKFNKILLIAFAALVVLLSLVGAQAEMRVEGENGHGLHRRQAKKTVTKTINKTKTVKQTVKVTVTKTVTVGGGGSTCKAAMQMCSKTADCCAGLECLSAEGEMMCQ